MQAASARRKYFEFGPLGGGLIVIRPGSPSLI